MNRLSYLLILVLFSTSVSAQISRYIKVSASGTGDGTSWTNAAGTANLQTIIDEVAAATNQGTVYFAAGTYLITAQIQLKNNVQLMGGYAADGSGTRDLLNNQTILDGQFNKRILYTGDKSPLDDGSTNNPFTKITKVDGFVLQRGSSTYGSAVAMSIGVVLENCIIRNNIGSIYGAAVFMKRHEALNSGKPAGWNFGGALINCVIVNNTSSNYAAAVFVNQDTHFSIINCVIANNKSTDATNGVGGLFVGANIRYSRIANNIFYNNTSPVSGRNNFFSPTTNFAAVWANYFSDSSIPIGLGTEVTGASPNHANLTSTNFANPQFQSSTTFDGHAGSDNIKKTEIENSDWRLKCNSPLIGLGTNPLGRADIPYPYQSAYLNGGTTGSARAFNTVTMDIQGSTRVINSTVEMGAYEYDPITSTVSSSNNSHGTVNANKEVSKGSKITQTATPASGYRFINWTENGSEVSTSAAYTFTAITNRVLLANFASNSVIIESNVNTDASLLNNCNDCDVILTGGTLNVNSTKTIKSLTVESGAKVDVANALNITGNLILKAGKDSSPGVKVDAGMTLTGNLTLERTFDNSKWYFVSFPSNVAVNDIQKVSGAGSLSLETNWWIKYYDGALRAVNSGMQSNWKNVTAGETLLANKGYVIGFDNSLAGDYVLSFPLNKNLVTQVETARTVSVSNYGEGSVAATHVGWNLVGVPYLSSFTGANIGATYLTFHNGSTYVQEAKVNVPSVSAFSAFFIQASTAGTGAQLSFDLFGRQSVKSLVDSPAGVYKLSLSTTSGVDFSTIILDENESLDYRIDSDLEKWLTTNTDVPQIYTVADGIRLVFNALSPNDAVGIPLEIYTKTATQAVISLQVGSDTGFESLWLTDKQTGQSVDLFENNYSFNTIAGLNNNRFVVSVRRISTQLQNHNSEMVRMNVSGNKLTLTTNVKHAHWSLFDIAGNLVAETESGDRQIQFMLPAKGLYVLHCSAQGKKISKKIIY